MVKTKENKNRSYKSWFIVIGSLLLLLGLAILSFKFHIYSKDKELKQESLDIFYQEQEIIKNNQEEVVIKQETVPHSNYIAVLKIPKINLEQGLVDRNSESNNVDLNIQILNESSMPDIENGNTILASHNGNAKTSYFRYLYRVKNGDNIMIYYNGYEYQYKVINTYKVDKTGKINIIRNKQKTTLTLITCSGLDKQLVVVSELINRL